MNLKTIISPITEIVFGLKCSLKIREKYIALANEYCGNAHCIKDRVLLDETYGSGGFMAWTKNNNEVIWSEQRSI